MAMRNYISPTTPLYANIIMSFDNHLFLVGKTSWCLLVYVKQDTTVPSGTTLIGDDCRRMNIIDLRSSVIPEPLQSFPHTNVV